MLKSEDDRMPQDVTVRVAANDLDLHALVAAAAAACDVPIAFIGMSDGDRFRRLAHVGFAELGETPHNTAAFSHVRQSDGVSVIPDVRADGRFADDPLVRGATGVQMFAGAPLRLGNGTRIGAICIADCRPRTLTESQRRVLLHLADVAVQAHVVHQTARVLAESETRFRTLCEASPVGVFATDAEGACTYTNARWQEIYGLSAIEALGSGWSRTVHPEDRARVFAAWQHTTAGLLDFDVEFRVRRDDRTVRHVRSFSRPVLRADGTLASYVGSVRDVTEQRENERQLRRSEQLLNRTGELANIGGWEMDLATGELIWSAQTRAIHGVPADYRPLLTTAIHFYAPEARPIIETAVAQSITTGAPWDLELPFIQQSGTRIWVRAVGCAEFEDGKPIRLIGSFQDITQRVEERRVLEFARERVALATETSGIGIWDLDLVHGSLVWDESMYRLYGLEDSSLPATYETWASQVHEHDRDAVEQLLRDALAGIREFQTEFRVRWPDGSVHHLRATARVSRDSDGNPIRMVGVNWDVSSLRQLAKQLADQHELLRVTLQSIGDAVITTDALGVVTWLNPVAERLTGWPCELATGRLLSDIFRLVDAETRRPVTDPVSVCLQPGHSGTVASQALLLSRDGAEYGIEDSAAPIRTATGEVLGVVLVFRDVTIQRRLAREMSHRATHDTLTGLVNRAEFEARLQRGLEQLQHDEEQHAVLFIDLDQFKIVNDTCGHSIGDKLLQQVAKILTGVARRGDTVARLGGDEFAILLAHCNTEQGARVAQKICDRMEDYRFSHEERRFRIGASIGLVPVDRRWATTAALLHAADTSCYAAKHAGRNRVHVWLEADGAIRARHGEAEWAARLENALDQNLFVLHAQRIDALRAGDVGLHAEVLLRLQAPDGSLIPPGAFLPAAERFHLATRVDRWVLQHALDALRQLPDLTRVRTLCVNVSGQSIGDLAFHRQAFAALAAAGPEVCRRICFEITETSAATNLADAAAFIEQVRSLGVRIALDDFGAGASAFGYLKTLTFDILKIDGQFIRNLLNDPLDHATVRCFVDVAAVVGVKTVAEFVDSPAVLERVREMGIDFAQGFHLHAPEPLDRVLGRIVRQPARQAEALTRTRATPIAGAA